MANNQQLLMGEGAGGAPVVYVEDVFSTYLYTGNGTTQTITNNIDLSTKGGLVWIKARNTVDSHRLFDTSRGVGNYLVTNGTFAELNNAASVTAFNSNGFSLGSFGGTNDAFNYASWTFREQPKFFDIVTWTGNGTNRTIAHTLGVVPGCIIVKRTDTAEAWAIYHRSLANTQYLVLNTTAAAATGATWWNSTTPTSAVFSVGTDASVNASGGTYVAYIYAHDAGGFGAAGTDNVISCGSFTTVSNGKMSAAVNLGYEPQWLLAKRSVSAENWVLYDTMRGLDYSGYNVLYPNLSNAEDSSTTPLVPTATGFDTPTANGPFANSTTYIYIAIRRGPMKVPTVGTSVYSPVVTAALGFYTTGFVVDGVITTTRNVTPAFYTGDRLRGGGKLLNTPSTAAEQAYAGWYFDSNTGVNQQQDPRNSINWNFQRAPSFFDVVCYTGTGVAGRTVTHNLAVAPELVIVKKRSASENWGTLYVATSSTGALDSTTGLSTANNQYYFGNDTIYIAPTSSVFTVGSVDRVNTSGGTYVAYLFATCAGVSKVGGYTGNGSSQTIACGFTAGSRFVMIKRTDSTGDWYVWDSARGIVAGNDPHLSLNTTAAEVTSDDSVDTDNSGFIVNQLSATNINVTSATYIFLAIA
jgi:hypothetical protein